MADRPLLTPEDLVSAAKLVSEYNKLANPAETKTHKPSPDAKVHIYYDCPTRGRITIQQITYGEYLASVGSRNTARAAVIRDQLLDYGVKVD